MVQLKFLSYKACQKGLLGWGKSVGSLGLKQKTPPPASFNPINALY